MIINHEIRDQFAIKQSMALRESAKIGTVRSRKLANQSIYG